MLWRGGDPVSNTNAQMFRSHIQGLPLRPFPVCPCFRALGTPRFPQCASPLSRARASKSRDTRCAAPCIWCLGTERADGYTSFPIVCCGFWFGFNVRFDIYKTASVVHLNSFLSLSSFSSTYFSLNFQSHNFVPAGLSLSTQQYFNNPIHFFHQQPNFKTSRCVSSLPLFS